MLGVFSTLWKSLIQFGVSKLHAVFAAVGRANYVSPPVHAALRSFLFVMKSALYSLTQKIWLKLPTEILMTPHPYVLVAIRLLSQISGIPQAKKYSGLVSVLGSMYKRMQLHTYQSSSRFSSRARIRRTFSTNFKTLLSSESPLSR